MSMKLGRYLCYSQPLRQAQKVQVTCFCPLGNLKFWPMWDVAESRTVRGGKSRNRWVRRCLLAVCGMAGSVPRGVVNNGKLINLTSSGRRSAWVTWFRVITGDASGYIGETIISFKTRFQVKKHLASRSALSLVYKQEEGHGPWGGSLGGER